jgi:hypothetical protein
MLKPYSKSIWLFESLLTYKRIVHFISSRHQGFSDPPYDSFNLSFHVGDEPEKVLKNRQLLSSKLGFLIEDFVTLKQVHGANIVKITEKNRGQGAFDYKSAIEAADGMITNLPGICLMVLIADCVPMLFYDPNQQIIGVAHAGWKGTTEKIAENMVNTMVKQYGARPKDIIVCIGPSIGPCCYEIRSDVIKEIQNNLGGELIIFKDNRYYFDLWRANKVQLFNLGIGYQNMELSGFCTKCRRDIFFSFRGERGRTGRFGAGIMIKRE